MLLFPGTSAQSLACGQRTAGVISSVSYSSHTGDLLSISAETGKKKTKTLSLDDIQLYFDVEIDYSSLSEILLQCIIETLCKTCLTPFKQFSPPLPHSPKITPKSDTTSPTPTSVDNESEKSKSEAPSEQLQDTKSIIDRKIYVACLRIFKKMIAQNVVSSELSNSVLKSLLLNDAVTVATDSYGTNDVAYFEEYLNILSAHRLKCKADEILAKEKALEEKKQKESVQEPAQEAAETEKKEEAPDIPLPPETPVEDLQALSDPLIGQLADMGFPIHWCKIALEKTSNDVEAALNWILCHGNELSEQDEKKNGADQEKEEPTDSGTEWPQTYHFDPQATSFLPVRSECSLTGCRLGAILPGDNVLVLKEEGEWVQVQGCDAIPETRGDSDDESDKGLLEETWVLRRFGGKDLLLKGPCPDMPVKLESMVMPVNGADGTPLVIKLSSIYKVSFSEGALIQTDVDPESDEIGALQLGTEVVVSEETLANTGEGRIHLTSPINGWSNKFPLFVKVRDIETPSETEDTKNNDASEVLEDLFNQATCASSYSRETRYFMQPTGNSSPGQSFEEQLLFPSSAKSRRTKSSAPCNYGSIWDVVEKNALKETEESLAIVTDYLKVLLSRQIYLAVALQRHQQGLKLVVPCVANEEEYATSFVQFFKLCMIRSFNGPSYLSAVPLGSVHPFLASDPFSPSPKLISGYLKNILEAKDENRSFVVAVRTTLLQDLRSHIYSAATSAFAEKNWDENDLEDVNDSDCIHDPHMRFLTWLSRFLWDLLVSNEEKRQIFSYWVVGLKSSNLVFKHRIFLELSNLLQGLLLKLESEPATDTSGASTCDLLRICIQELSSEKLIQHSIMWLDKEQENAPLFSQYLQALLDLVAVMRTSEIVLQSNSNINPPPILPLTQAKSERLRTDSLLGYCEGAPSERPVMDFKDAESRVKTRSEGNVQISPPWTAEFWLYRASINDSSAVSESTGSSALALDKEASFHTEEQPTALEKQASSQTEEKPMHDQFKTVPAFVLAASLNTELRLQLGGRVYGPLSEEEGEKDAEVVPDEAFCLGFMKKVEDKEKLQAFDFVVPEKTWIHLCIVAKKSDELLLYANGEQACPPVFGRFDLPLGALGILQKASPTTRSFVGSLCQVRYWRAAWSAPEVKRALAQPVAANQGLELLMRFNEGTGDKIKDRAGSRPSVCECHKTDWRVVTDIPWETVLKCGERDLWPLRSYVGLDSRRCQQLRLDSPTALSAVHGREEVESDLVEMCGIFRRGPSRNVQPPWAKAKTQVCHLQYRPKPTPVVPLEAETEGLPESTGIIFIEGSIEWPESETLALIEGTLENKSTWNVKVTELIRGDFAELEWLQGMEIAGVFDEFGVQCVCNWKAVVDAVMLPPLRTGQMRFDEALLPNPVEVSYNDSSTCLGGILKAPPETPAYMVHAILCPEDCVLPVLPSAPVDEQAPSQVEELKTEAKLDTAAQYWGLVSGRRFWEVQIMEHNGLIAIGVCTQSAKVTAFDSKAGFSWQYTTEASISHGESVTPATQFAAGDVIGVEVDFKAGSISFFRNGSSVGISFEGIAEHADLSSEKPPECRGLRPFVYLSGNSSVQLLGFKNGIARLVKNETVEEKTYTNTFEGAWEHGYRHGKGMFTSDDTRFCGREIVCHGNWHFGYMHGIYLYAVLNDDKKEENPHCVVFENGKQLRDATPEEGKELLDEWLKAHPPPKPPQIQTEETEKEKKEAKPRHPPRKPRSSDAKKNDPRARARRKKLRRLQAAAAGKASHSQPPSETASAVASDAEEEIKSDLEEEIKAETQLPSEEVEKLMTQVPSNDEDAKETKAEGEIKLEAEVESGEKQETEGVVKPIEEETAKSETSTEQNPEKEPSTDQPSADTPELSPYLLKIVYTGGATVREGIEIDSSEVVGTLYAGTEVEAFETAMTTEGIPRFRTKSGWISEVLRGETREPVTQILRHTPPAPLSYRVIITSGGAKLRKEASLESEDLGSVPTDTVVEVTERQQVLVPGELTMRLKIAAPEKYRGWISEKPHIVRVELSAAEQEAQARDKELKRRKVVRASRDELKQRIMSKETQTNSLKKLKTKIEIAGSLELSTQIPFLLNSQGCRSDIKISPDFATASATSQSGRGIVLGTKGFQGGIHYWEVRIDNAGWGTTFIGVAPRGVNGWNGFGFLSYRAVQKFGHETLYGAYYTAGDKIGVLLDMDRGTLSFVKDGEDFNLGKPVILQMGIAYHNLRKLMERYSGQDPNQTVILYPCFGMKNAGDVMSLESQNWWSKKGFDSAERLAQTIDSLVTVQLWRRAQSLNRVVDLPLWVLDSIYKKLRKWKAQKKRVYMSRAGVEVEIDTDQQLLRAAAGPVGEMCNLQVGHRITTPYGEGQVVGVARGNVWFKMDGEEKGSFYWNQKELANLVGSGIVNFSEQPANDLEDSQETGSVMSFEEFTDALSGWTKGKEDALVHLINSLCNKKGCGAAQLSPLDFKKALASSKTHTILTEAPENCVEALFACILYFNRTCKSVVEFVDLAREEKRMKVLTADENEELADSLRTPLNFLTVSGQALSKVRDSLLTHVKMEHWSKIIQETTTFTTPPPDEYEKPEEIREINVNRMQARHKLAEAEGTSPQELLNVSLFGQLRQHFTRMENKDLRRGFSHVQDHGQARAFYVKFVGEGVDDHGGPYRAVFQTALAEEAQGPLELFVPCPNAEMKAGSNQDQVILNPIHTDAEQLALFTHFGKLLGLACRHRIQININLPRLIWKPLVAQAVEFDDLKSIDKGLSVSLKNIEESRLDPSEREDLLKQILGHSMMKSGLSDDEESRLVSKIIKQKRMKGNEEALAHLYMGLSCVVPTELFALFTPDELSTLFCGVPQVDLELLKSMTEYTDGLGQAAPHVQYFWEALEELDETERQAFINFCSGKSRLPSSAADFSMHFKIAAPHPSTNKDPDHYLPIAQTCFFSLSIPEYSSKEICLEKLRYAIGNADLMDADFIMRNAEGWENIN